MHADEVTRTFDCKTRDCPNESRSRVGRYSYCDNCRALRASMSDAPKPAQPKLAGSFEAHVKALGAAGKNADRLAAHAKKLTERALAAKANADRAAEEVRSLARGLTEA